VTGAVARVRAEARCFTPLPALFVVEATNSSWSNYGQLRRNTGRRNRHRHAALRLATTVLIVGKLIEWRNRWNPE